MVTRYYFSCNECEKKFEIKGYWFNQFLLHWILDYKYMVHKIIFHKRKPTIKYFIKMNVIIIPLLLFQIIDIPIELLRWML